MARTSASANKRVKKAAAKASESKPGELPDPPSELGKWLEEQVKAGLAPPEVLKEFREREGAPDLLPAEMKAPELIPPRSRRMDQTLGDEQWQLVYKAYAATGEIDALVLATGLETTEIDHLLNYGVKRLGLPPIREAAVNYAEAAHRTKELVEQGAKDPGYLRHLAEARDAATERTAREAAAAQGALISNLKVTDTFLGLVNAVLERSLNADGGFDLPEKITPNLLDKLAKAASNLTRSVDTAVRLSRFTAGEPERNVTFEIAALVGRMSEDDLREYLSTGSIPSHLRIKGSNFIDADFEEVEAPPPAPPALPEKE